MLHFLIGIGTRGAAPVDLRSTNPARASRVNGRAARAGLLASLAASFYVGRFSAPAGSCWRAARASFLWLMILGDLIGGRLAALAGSSLRSQLVVSLMRR